MVHTLHTTSQSLTKRMLTDRGCQTAPLTLGSGCHVVLSILWHNGKGSRRSCQPNGIVRTADRRNRYFAYNREAFWSLRTRDISVKEIDGHLGEPYPVTKITISLPIAAPFRNFNTLFVRFLFRLSFFFFFLFIYNTIVGKEWSMVKIYDSCQFYLKLIKEEWSWMNSW